MGARGRKIDTFIYRIADFLMASLAWSLFFAYRSHSERGYFDVSSLYDSNLFLGALLIPTAWMFFYAIFDKYGDVYRMSRLSVFGRTFVLSLFGVTFLFFAFILDDIITVNNTYTKSFLMLFSFHFLLTAISRMTLLTRVHRKLKKGLVSFKTLLVGANKNAFDLYKEINERDYSLGYDFIGFINTNGKADEELSSILPVLGKLDDINRIIEQEEVEEIIIAVETSERDKVKDILNRVFLLFPKLSIKIIPSMYDILLGHVRMTHVIGAVLIDIQQDIMPNWQKFVKRLIDITASFFAIIILSPLYIYIAIRVKMSSKGPIVFKQERIGRFGKPFMIYKFRSMPTDAEARGPQLSSDLDSRCTPWGAVMRKWRLDELPQFWNVIIGDMSLVGPRPERQYYIDLIEQQAPHYRHLLSVRPGITSWGQVKYGYASNVDQMLQRLKFDILYIENRSLLLDMKILLYTILVLIQGKGK